jgi:hypothetical protein
VVSRKPMVYVGAERDIPRSRVGAGGARCGVGLVVEPCNKRMKEMPKRRGREEGERDGLVCVDVDVWDGVGTEADGAVRRHWLSLPHLLHAGAWAAEPSRWPDSSCFLIFRVRGDGRCSHDSQARVVLTVQCCFSCACRGAILASTRQSYCETASDRCSFMLYAIKQRPSAIVKRVKVTSHHTSIAFL